MFHGLETTEGAMNRRQLDEEIAKTTDPEVRQRLEALLQKRDREADANWKSVRLHPQRGWPQEGPPRGPNNVSSRNGQAAPWL